MTGRRILLTLLLMFGLTAYAEAQTPVIVQLSPLGNITSITRILNGTVIDSIPDAHIYLLSLPLSSTLNSLLSPLSPVLGLLGIQWAEIDSEVTLPNIGQLGVLQTAAGVAPNWYEGQPTWQIMHAQNALAYSRGAGVIIADLNSRVDSTHPAIASHLIAGYDFVAGKSTGTAALNQSSASFLDQSSASFLDQSSASFLDQSSASFLDGLLGLPTTSSNPAYGHGTECAGVLAAIAPDSLIMPLRIFDDNGQTDLFSAAKAIRYAVQHGAQVINMSFGTFTNSNAIKNSIAYAQSMNVTLTASAGNNNTTSPQYPAAYSGVITTAATNILDQKASFSNYGNSIVVDAPGVNVIVPYPGGMYSVVSGTSFSAPAVAGTAALIRSLRATGTTVSITGAAVNINAENPNYVNKLGYGRIDVLQSVKPN